MFSRVVQWSWLLLGDWLAKVAQDPKIPGPQVVIANEQSWWFHGVGCRGRRVWGAESFPAGDESAPAPAPTLCCVAVTPHSTLAINDIAPVSN